MPAREDDACEESAAALIFIGVFGVGQSWPIRKPRKRAGITFSPFFYVLSGAFVTRFIIFNSQ